MPDHIDQIVDWQIAQGRARGEYPIHPKVDLPSVEVVPPIDSSAMIDFFARLATTFAAVRSALSLNGNHHG